MKNPIFRFGALLFLFLFSSCHDEPEPIVRLMDKYLMQAGFTEVVEQIDIEDREFGIKFRPTVDGMVTGFFVTIPDERVEYRITLWDAEQQVVLDTWEVMYDQGRTANGVGGIGMDFHLTAGKEYMMTFNSNDWFEYKGTSDANYPIEVDDILITGFGFAVGTDQTFPTEFPISYIGGNLNFSFKAD